MNFSFSDKNPKKPWFTWVFWILSFILINLILLIPQTLFHLSSFTSFITLQGICELGIIGSALLINHFYTKEQLVFRHWNLFSHSFIFDFLFIYYLMGILLLHHEMHHVVLYGILAILIGCAEEISFRGILLSSFIHNWRGKHPLLMGILLSSFLFGISHSINAFSQPLKNTVVQMVVAFSLGIILALMYLVTGNLVTPILFHALIDFTSISISNSTESQAGWQTAMPLLIIALIILVVELRPSVRRKIEQNFQL